MADKWSGVLGIESLGQSEVEDLHRPPLCHLDVGRFQVAMNDPALVRLSLPEIPNVLL